MAMRFEHEFTVPVPVEQAWSALLDVERVAPCLPGAALETVEGDKLTGRMKVKVGPITLVYRGEAAFENVDAQARTLTLKAAGKESRGPGTASATVVARLRPEGAGDSGTRVTVETSFTVTGRPAQFGRGVMAEVGAKLIDRFAANLSGLLEGRGAEAPPVAAGPVGGPEAVVASEELTAPKVQDGSAVGDLDGHGEFSGQEASHRHLSAVPPAPEVTAAVRTPERATAPEGAPETAATGESRGHDTTPAEEARGRDTRPAGTARTSRTPDEEALDLLEIAGIPLLRRAAPVAGALAGLVLAGWLIRRALRRRGVAGCR